MRSLKHRKNKFVHIRCNLAGKISIITLSETWLSDADNSEDYTIQGYQGPFRRDHDGVNRAISYGGVLAWVADNVACKRHRVLELLNIEAMWLEVRVINK